MSFAFALAGEGTDVLELDIYSVIGESFWFDTVSARQVRRAIKQNSSAKTIRVRINSSGGDVLDAIAIYSQLQQHNAKVIVNIDGLAASAASVVAMAGDEIIASTGAFVMIHNAWGIVQGQSDDMRAHAELVDKMTEQIAQIYAKRTGLDVTKIRQMMDQETWLAAEEAKRLGFVSSIFEPQPDVMTKARAVAMASVHRGDYRNLPEQLRQRILPYDGSLNWPPPSGQSNNPTAGNGDRQMSAISNVILAALGLPENSSESDATRAIKTRSDLLASFESETGKSGEEALGVIRAWKASHAELPAVQADLTKFRAEADKAAIDALINKGREDKKLTKAEADKLRAQVSSNEISLAAARAFIEVMAPKNFLSGEEDPAPQVRAVRAGLNWNGKMYEELSTAERLALANADENLFQQMRRDWEKRDCPVVQG